MNKDVFKVVGALVFMICLSILLFYLGFVFYGHVKEVSQDYNFQDTKGTTWSQLRFEEERRCVGGYVRIRVGHGLVDDYDKDGKLVKCWDTSKEGFQLN